MCQLVEMMLGFIILIELPLTRTEARTMHQATTIDCHHPKLFVQQFVVHYEVDNISGHSVIIQ